MPYIKTSDRRVFDKCIDHLIDQLTHDPLGGDGDLNYVITRLCLGVLGRIARYGDYRNILGDLEAVKLELYRRRIATYEDVKILENGDVYE